VVSQNKIERKRAMDNRDIKKGIASLGDKELCEAIYGVMRALGMSEAQSARLSSDPSAIRRVVNGASEREIGDIMKKIGADKGDELIKKLKL